MVRRTWEEWRALVERQRESGLSVSEFCCREQTTENSFYRWRRRLSDEMETSFVRLLIVERAMIEIGLSCEATLKVTADRQSLQAVFAALLSVDANGA